ncbi:MAG: hypothetical protein IPL54_04630 [Chitinophagaceae bacterium]|nr:hypothetical protein [Chitinophagaceae bacterium]
MKKTALYFLLFSYAMVILKPVTPYVSDAVAHIFYYSQHMATVHYENGKMHVHREIVNNAKEEQPAKEIPASKRENSANDHTGLQQKQLVQVLPVTRSYQIPFTASLLQNYLAAEYPPPRA